MRPEQLLAQHQAACGSCRRGWACGELHNLQLAQAIQLLDSVFPGLG